MEEEDLLHIILMFWCVGLANIRSSSFEQPDCELGHLLSRASMPRNVLIIVCFCILFLIFYLFFGLLALSCYKQKLKTSPTLFGGCLPWDISAAQVSCFASNLNYGWKMEEEEEEEESTLIWGCYREESIQKLLWFH